MTIRIETAQFSIRLSQRIYVKPKSLSLLGHTLRGHMRRTNVIKVTGILCAKPPDFDALSV